MVSEVNLKKILAIIEFGAEFGLRPRAAFNCKDADLASQWDAWKNKFNWCLNATKWQGRRGGASQRAHHVFGNLRRENLRLVGVCRSS
jgi:hypothetical protein